MENTSKAAAFFDLDNTMIRGASLFHLSRGLNKHHFFTFQEASNFVWKQLKFVVAGKEHIKDMDSIRSMGLKIACGKSVEELDRIGDAVVDDHLMPKIFMQTLELAKKHIERGEQVWLVTASPQRLASKLAHRLGLTGALGTIAAECDGVFTGELVGEPLHGAQKAVAITELAQRENLDLSKCTAYSDSIYDVPMLTLVGNAVTVNADRRLRALARKNKWKQYDFRKMRHARKYGLGALIASFSAGCAVVFGKARKK
ncbi:MAG: Phosphoserine phosphatase [Actinomycetota bacterium]|jgi:HAD superfamily hydrolase (TIGR01490 family)